MLLKSGPGDSCATTLRAAFAHPHIPPSFILIDWLTRHGRAPGENQPDGLASDASELCGNAGRGLASICPAWSRARASSAPALAGAAGTSSPQPPRMTARPRASQGFTAVSSRWRAMPAMTILPPGQLPGRWRRRYRVPDFQRHRRRAAPPHRRPAWHRHRRPPSLVRRASRHYRAVQPHRHCPTWHRHRAQHRQARRR